MAKAKVFIPAIDEVEAEPEKIPFADVYMIGIPIPTYKALSDAATKRGLTVAQLLKEALETVLTKE